MELTYIAAVIILINMFGNMKINCIYLRRNTVAEENEYASIYDPVIHKHPKKLLLMRILTQRVVKSPVIQFFGDFKKSLSWLKYLGFFNKKIHIFQKNSGWQTWLTFWSMYNVSFLRDALYFYDFDLYKTQKTRTHNLQNLGVILIGCMMF